MSGIKRAGDPLVVVLVLILMLALLVQGSIGYSSSYLIGAESGAPGRRTLGTPVSGFWNAGRGTGALPDVIPPSDAAITSEPAGGVPNSFSWNGYFGGVNYMTPVRDQGACGSCWAFAAVGDVEAQYQITRGNPSTGIDLSEQNVLQCSGGSCSGWYLSRTLDFLKNYGTPDEACNPYTAADNPCGTGRCSDYLSRLYYVAGWTWISTGATNIKNYIYTHGPVTVWMPIFSDFPWYDPVFWQYYFYGHGWDGIEPFAGHFVVIVGWDDQGPGTDDDYWIVRNSWGTTGGDANSGYGGYFYMTQDPTYGFFGTYQQAAVISAVTHRVPFGQAAPAMLNAPTKTVYFIFPDGNRAHRKPPGVGYASVTDWTALGYVFGSLANMPQITALDTNSTYVDQATGAPRIHDSIIVLFGGTLVNELVHYYEENRVAPLWWSLEGSWSTGTLYYRTRSGEVGVSMPIQTVGGGLADMMLVEAFTDPFGNTVLIYSGFGWQGTFTSGFYFKTVLCQDGNLAGLTDSWYFYSWTDKNGNGFVEDYEVNPIPTNQGN